MQFEVCVVDMRILIDMVDPLGVEGTGPAFDAVDDIAFFEQEFGKVGTVLAGDAGDEGYLGEWAVGSRKWGLGGVAWVRAHAALHFL